MTNDERAVRRLVRDRYADAASDGCCGGAETSCCGGGDSGSDASGTDGDADRIAREIGYDDESLETVEGEANLGLGCGNPTAIADLEPGETVLDLGSGGGFDCFLAAREVGPEGRVIGVDMTPEMIEKARANAGENDAGNVSFRLGEIEHLPVADTTVDVIISNCVVNLSPAKDRVFEEAYRVLRPGGRLAITDPVRIDSLPDGVRGDPGSLAGCISGAESPETITTLLEAAGFVDISVELDPDSREVIDEWHDEYDLGGSLLSARIEAEKPAE
ncbi:arsenite methyltransferase [Halapricum desulfuricans]|uniref:Arsenite methyltransferase n=1 Tax=Halapricum desulfuricans TaxID=2841257 RepID=A0A897NVF0_9EURY|nr:arsenite methyltransferase [Halapricum desulfuricans]QSG16211.1 SAM-dependent methyltransferase [Halapricum desulfuricans]